MATYEQDGIINYKSSNGDMNILYPATKWDNVMDAPDVEGHLANTLNPHGVTKAQVGLGNVDNTSDLNKPISTATQTALNNKVDKSGSKVLSDNNYTTTEKNKLAGIATGANNYVHPSTHPATMIVEDETHRFTSDDAIAAIDQSIANLQTTKANFANSVGGFEAGVGAKTLDHIGGSVDAIQLGSGTNTEFHTLKIYDNTLLNEDGKIPLDRIPDVALGVNTIYLVTPDATISDINSASHSLSYVRESDGKWIWQQVQEIIDANTSETVQTKLVFVGKLIINETYPEVTITPVITIKSGIIIEGHFEYTGNHIYNNGQHLFQFADGAKNCGIQNSTLCETVADTLYNNDSLLAGGTSGTNLTNVFLNNIKYINPRNVSVSTYNMSTCFDLTGDGIYINNLSFDIATPRYGSNCVVKVGGTNALVENIPFGLASFELASTNSTVLNCTMAADNGYNNVFYVSGTKNYIENVRVYCTSAGSNRTTITNGNKLVGVTNTVGATTTILDSLIGADFVSVTDLGNYFASTTVEGALQEIGLNKANKALEAWTMPTLTNSWVAYDSTRTPKYRKDGFGRVYFKGAVKSGTSGNAIFQLAAGYRPLQTVSFLVNANNTATAYCTIDTSGYVMLTSSVVTLVSLDSISFYTD